MRPTINEGGQRPLRNEVQSEAISETLTEKEERALSKMVDWGIALKLNDDDLDEVESAFSTFSHEYECTLTQSTSYTDKCPIFIDIEMKKATVPDPRVQLAVWAQAALKKRRHHHWNTDLPMPGIIVEKHEWNCYLFFEMAGNLVCTSHKFSSSLVHACT